MLRRSTKVHEAKMILFVPFRVISWIVLAEAVKKHQTELRPCPQTRCLDKPPLIIRIESRYDKRE
jgi:hypothetical protein